MMEQVHSEEVVRVLGEALEEVDLEAEGWVAPEQALARVESAFVLNAGLSSLTRLEFPVTTKIVPNVG